jgi:hypothetical protein
VSSIKPPFFIVCEPQNDLVITPERYNEWRLLADAQGVIYWNREGMVRIVPNEVLDNALHVFSDYRQMISSGRLVHMPETAKRILWEQAREAVKH